MARAHGAFISRRLILSLVLLPVQENQISLASVKNHSKKFTAHHLFSFSRTIKLNTTPVKLLSGKKQRHYQDRDFYLARGLKMRISLLICVYLQIGRSYGYESWSYRTIDTFYGNIDLREIQHHVHQTTEFLIFLDYENDDNIVPELKKYLSILSDAADIVNKISAAFQRLPKTYGLEFPLNPKENRRVIPDVFEIQNPTVYLCSLKSNEDQKYVTTCNLDSFLEELRFIKDFLYDFYAAHHNYVKFLDLKETTNQRLCKKVFNMPKCAAGLRKAEEGLVLEVYLERKPLIDFNSGSYGVQNFASVKLIMLTLLSLKFMF